MTQKANKVLRRALADLAAAEAEKIHKKRTEAFKLRRLRAEAAALKVKDDAVEKQRKVSAAALKAKLAAAPLEYEVLQVNADTREGFKLRTQCLDRLKLRAPALAVEHEVKWPRVRDFYARFVVKTYQASAGKFFLDRVNRVLEKLGAHYAGNTPWNRKGEKGDALAFLNFFMENWRKIPKESTTAVV